ncbi:muramoyltetrapeptide carboxypeptidase [Pandoraea pulmonicola]|uniref:Muramoyltetrapeptide carboxypeptidase n=1 Tax=Pandoraea pulmonicola TaxID=93221 RepID=A0AAJ5CYN4_PANPU|nr:muramoyltetrapeptide carboxypeptidase [Pandoraea pulmonicola]AJC22211.1 muramoyltetrapeptide carboxypeptidase [Pandoraea pulmonicola]SUA88744.1 Murein tetrapeptide carboxypeptidase [Pandoraea pulmonicola]
MTQTRLIELIAPSGYAPNAEVAERGVQTLERLGYTVSNREALARRHLRFAGTDAERVAEINRLARRDHPVPDIVLAVRGGYGAVHLLDHLDYEGLHRRLSGASVAIVGHSDFTALQLALLSQAHLITFAGPMLLADFGAETPSDFTLDQFRSVLSAPSHVVGWTGDGASGDIDVSGTLWGGNLAMVCSLIGTRYLPQIEGGVLFVEDVNEPPYRVERMIYQLHQTGILARQRALVLGDFSEYRLSDYDNGYDMAAMIENMRRVVGIPIVTGLPFGHCPDKLTLPVGGQARLQTAGAQATLTLTGYPYIAS